MKITGIIWLEEIVEKLAYKHRVEQQEVREVLANSPQFCFIEKGHRAGENVYAASGQTDAGRYLIVFFIHKQDKRALILSAREMTPTERKSYGKK
jgi:uncharacterized DUF497 family protein